MQANYSTEALRHILGSRDQVIERLRLHCTEIEQHRAALGGQLHDASARAAALENQLRDAHARAAALENQLRDAHARAAALENQLRDAHARAAALENQLRDAHLRLDALMQLGPIAIGLARRFHAVACAFPRLRKIGKALFLPLRLP